MKLEKHPPTPEKLLKKEGRDIRQMFASIAPTYDLLNSLLSLGFDARWRKRVVELVESSPNARVLDLCTGTAELALTFAHRLDPKGCVVASDFCWEMLSLAQPKLKKYGGGCPVALVQADALCLPFPDESFDVASVAFGIRNVSNLTQGLKEMVRVVKPGGKVVILEFSLPAGPIFGRLYNFYFNTLLPWVGNSISAGSGPATASGRLRAYSYLPASVVKFARPEELKREMESCGLTEVEYHPLTLGIVTVYAGKRP
ncbi:MAG TPA: bifunctional demethylmenaquinone methyltransferase/2-methoxy-6-polyprenyl-1,4-benzoquinol methylase UbiE [Candidatus Tripitaka californicus]|uniref:bifunctional demethylmenaquinone methyltransferase/2-methoxy-6-polyprenyl-1,4-benzoquinol methylase UbiE n=2 Tax=Candidatus Tripitaka californicus TaxID=3367616 RepID=UPI00402942BC|nr:bifunctional demethylmenaquinone methyltransferase/2-methoxy-6-polyprenyl-1,4-benzoquinol methylase UbiE [Planctomycetota bacterium]